MRDRDTLIEQAPQYRICLKHSNRRVTEQAAQLESNHPVENLVRVKSPSIQFSHPVDSSATMHPV